ncbi:MAG: hypothetical protein RSC66_14245, partial [Comamonas sp.]
MTIQLNPAALQGISAAQVSDLDVETLLMAVQNQRATLLEGQLQTQMDDVQQRNANIGKLNDLLGAARTLSANFESDAKSTEKLPTGEEFAAFEKAATAAGVSVSTIKDKGTLTTAIENYKTMIDTQSNSQQMDMLRLQSLSNKRNEAFEVM